MQSRRQAHCQHQARAISCACFRQPKPSMRLANRCCRCQIVFSGTDSLLGDAFGDGPVACGPTSRPTPNLALKGQRLLRTFQGLIPSNG
eukprot:4833619-Amphidinium_carterae.1